MFYFRYVEDIITCIQIERIDEILSICNSYNVRLQFTHEIEKENKISFLDVLIIRDDENYSTRFIIRWLILIGIQSQLPQDIFKVLNLHPLLQKITMIYNLVDRAIHLAKNFTIIILKKSRHYSKTIVTLKNLLRNT